MSHFEDPMPDFKWPITVAGPIGAPAQKVWEVISAPGNLEACHPFCAKNPVAAWPGEDSRDSVHYLSGWVFERRFRRRSYLLSVVGGFEWFVTRGEPVPRNQFGRHPWFSEPEDADRAAYQRKRRTLDGQAESSI
jgi:hypothetical protein